MKKQMEPTLKTDITENDLVKKLMEFDVTQIIPTGDNQKDPMRTKLQLYFKWGISFEEPYQVPERAQREVYYAGKEELLMNIKKSLYSQPQPVTASKPDGYMSSYAEK